MALIRVYDVKDFWQAVQLNCRPETHMVVTDEVSIVMMVPIVTSQHRHYIMIKLDDEKKVSEVLKRLKEQGFRVIVGEVEFGRA